MSVAQFVLEDGLAINQRLHLVGKSIERLHQSLCEVRITHPIEWQMRWKDTSIRRVGRRRRRTSDVSSLVLTEVGLEVSFQGFLQVIQ